MLRNIVIVLVVIIILIAGYFIFLGQNSNLVNNPSNLSDSNSGQQLVEDSRPDNYKIFTKASYEQALASDKVVFLSFYANWCPTCRVEEPELIAGFNELESDRLIGFRVNFNDADTDEAEEALAKEFQVPYQHTKIFLKNGRVIARFIEQWTKEDFVREVNLILSE